MISTRARRIRMAVAGAVTIVLAVAGGRMIHRTRHAATPLAAKAPANAPPLAATPPPAASSRGFLYGRVLTVEGATYEGRLRWGGTQEAFWSDDFNGVRQANPWLAYVPPEQRPMRRRSLRLFGLQIPLPARHDEVRRQLVVRFGDIARLDAHKKAVRVTLENGTVVDVARYDASDFDDGVRVWDGRRGVVDLDSWRIRAIAFLATPPLVAAPRRLQGTVRTRGGELTGFVAWDGDECVGSDEVAGRSATGEQHLRFDTIRSIARASSESARVTLLDGRELVLSGSRKLGRGNRGIVVEDPRYGRVRISWDAFVRLELRPGDSGPASGDLTPGTPLTGSVTTRDGRRLAGRLVFDLDESETTDALDAPLDGIDYSIPFARIAAIRRLSARPGPRSATVTLRDGEELRLEAAGDLGDGNAGMLIFATGSPHPTYVPWSNVEAVELVEGDAAAPFPAATAAAQRASPAVR